MPTMSTPTTTAMNRIIGPGPGPGVGRVGVGVGVGASVSLHSSTARVSQIVTKLKSSSR